MMMVIEGDEREKRDGASIFFQTDSNHNFCRVTDFFSASLTHSGDFFPLQQRLCGDDFSSANRCEAISSSKSAILKMRVNILRKFLVVRFGSRVGFRSLQSV